MFEWDAEEGERNLKALPYVNDWFEGGAREAVAASEDKDEFPNPFCSSNCTL